MRISVGPVPVSWSRKAVLAFYDALALSSVDLVYVGNILHAARSCVQRRERLAIARELVAGGKGVVLSVSLADAEGDADSVRRLIDESGFPVEAGDWNMVALLGGKVPFVAGSSLACDNGQSLDRLVECGALRWVLPELCRGEVMRVLSYAGRSNCEIELPVLGHRSNFRWQCGIDRCVYISTSAHGMPPCNLALAAEADMPDWSSDIDTLRAGGVGVLRIAARTPRAIDVAQILSELVNGETGPDDAYRRYVDSCRPVLSQWERDGNGCFQSATW
jgi:hypothetical protein